MAKVGIIQATYSDPGIEALLAPFGGMERFVKKKRESSPQGQSFIGQSAGKGRDHAP